MAFSTHYRAEIHKAGFGSSKNVFLALMQSELQGIGLQNVLTNGDRILFGRGSPRYFSQWNLLTALDGCDIDVFANDGTLTVRYDVSFTTFFVLMVSVFVVGVVVWAVIAHRPLQVLLVGGLFVLVWLVFMGLLCRHVARKLVGIINSTLARSA